jgi:NAD(P)H dehydrogenase (quinone)
MTKFLNATIGVTGASGHLGRRVVELLLEAGASHVVAITRDPRKLADLAARAVEIRQGAFGDAAALAPAFAGVDRLLIISTDTLEGRAQLHISAIDAAEQAGVGHIVYTSLTSPYPDPTNLIADSHFWTEARLANGKATWSILRNNMYADYLVPGAQQAVATGTLFHAAGAGRRAFVTREDCAAAAVGALLGAEGRKIFDVCGPVALSGDDLAAVFSAISGKAIRAQSIDGAALAAGLAQGGVPAEMAGVLVRFDTDAAKGYLGIVSDAVEQLTGRPPQPISIVLTGALASHAASAA